MNYLVLVSFFCLLKYTEVSSSFLECQTKDDCLAETSYCENSLCQCPKGYTFSTDGSICLKVSIGYNSSCEDDAQCGWLLGKYQCNNGLCNCAEDWRYLRGRCRIKRGLNETCTEDDDCFNGYDLQAMKCEGNKCICSDAYYQRSDFDCRAAALNIGDRCAIDLDCKFENTVCSKSFCREKPETFSRLENSQYEINEENIIAKGFNEPCETDLDCSEPPNTFCSPLTKKCICKRGYVYNTAKKNCMRELGSDCSVNADCISSFSKCIKGKCYCTPTFFYNSANSACVKSVTPANPTCYSDEWCYLFGTQVKCKDQQCVCESTATLDQEYYICRPNADTCKTGCTTDEECISITDSVCSNDGKCVCKENFRLDANACLPNIGAECRDDAHCNLEHVECKGGVCSCADEFVANGTLNCLSVAEGPGGSCAIEAQCTAVLANSECLDGICLCRGGYVLKDDICNEEKYMGSVCNSAKQCHVLLGSRVQCRNSICQCSFEMQPTGDGLDCENKNSGAPNFGYKLVVTIVALFTLMSTGMVV